MSEDQDQGEKQHQPSQKKLDDARRKGEIPRSADLATAAGYGGLLVAALVFGGSSMLSIGEALSGFLARAPEIADMAFDPRYLDGAGASPVAGLLLDVAAALTPWLLLPGAAALLCILALQGLVFAPTKLEPKLSRISPIAGIKNKFGRNGLFEFAKSTVKLCIYGTILFLVLWADLPRILGSIRLTPGQITLELMRLSLRLMWIILAVALALGAVDYLWQRAEHLRKNSMTHKELRDETKESEGDPMLRQARRQKAVDYAMSRMMADVPKADVVIVNPVHFAVALKWDRRKGTAPICVAKGVDAVALNIKALAIESGVPVRSDPPTARALWAEVEIGQAVPPDHYKAVAAAIRFADRLRKVGRG